MPCIVEWALDHRSSHNVSGSAVRDRDPPICEFFQKAESDPTEAARNGLAALGRRRAIRFGRTMSVIRRNSEVSAMSEFLAVCPLATSASSRNDSCWSGKSALPEASFDRKAGAGTERAPLLK
jgi:hypothetical protein